MLDKDGEVRKTAVEALGYRRSGSVWAALSDLDPDVLITALEAIRIGEINGDLTKIEELLHHTDTEISGVLKL